jgi:hypothetical protein
VTFGGKRLTPSSVFYTYIRSFWAQIGGDATMELIFAHPAGFTRKESSIGGATWGRLSLTTVLRRPVATKCSSGSRLMAAGAVFGNHSVIDTPEGPMLLAHLQEGIFGLSSDILVSSPVGTEPPHLQNTAREPRTPPPLLE